MVNRDTVIEQFLAGSPWADWTQAPLAGDASARRYLRLTQNDMSVILMDADPETGQDTKPFAKIGTWLKAQKLSAPEKLLHDPDLGLMLISDLGPIDFAKHLNTNPAEANMLYNAAIDVLVNLDKATPPTDLIAMTPKVGGDMVAITSQWYADSDAETLTAEVSDHLDRLCGPADKIALRDFHAENLIWRPTYVGSDRVGLLDYQDAFIAPRGYDLVSLLRDVRRRVDKSLANRMTERFMTATGIKNAEAAFACLAVQRNLRILGVFARLAKRDGKTRYIQMIPHIWAMLTEDLMQPDLKSLQKCVLTTLPAPENATIKDLL